jgi:hypothetical protein
MALDQETKDFITAYVDSKITTVRIPELPENTYELSAEDKIPIHVSSDNKTRHETLGDLMTFFALGGDGTTTPGDSAAKGKYTFDVSALQAGSDTISLPQFAGKNATLTIDGRDFLDSEYDFLNAGGVKVNISGFKFVEGMRVTLHFAEPLADGGTTTGGSFIRGVVEVAVNTTLSADDARKLIQVRGGTSQIALTLPLVDTLTDNDFFIVECNLSNSKQQAVKTQGGQNIYLNSTSRTALYLSPGESLWLFRKNDGYYVLDAYAQLYNEVGHPVPRYKVGPGEILLKGQQVLKADYPRLYEAAQTFGGGFVAKSTYDADPLKYRGCYVEINTNTFQLPNLLNMALRGVESESGTDTNRGHNAPGGYQEDSVKAHTHPYKDRYHIDKSQMLNAATKKEAATAGYNGSLGTGDTDADNNTFLYLDATTDANTGEETVMKNIAIYWATKY